MEDGWSRVQRRKTSANKANGVVTNLFVTDIPNGVTKTEFKKIFYPFGRLSDVNFEGKRDRNGKNFGFIRFVGVSDVRELERKLNGTKCRNNSLEVNVERRKRNPPAKQFQANKQVPFSSKVNVNGGGNPIRNVGGSFKDGRSFADVTGKHCDPPTPFKVSPPPL